MVAMYVLLDGFDLGAGAVHFLVAKNVEERRQVIATIGPVWDGNEVWLLAAGGVLYFAFPLLYASGFSGFYLPLMIVLWLLILRGTSIEFRNHIKSTVWIPFWDFAFSFASLLLACSSAPRLAMLFAESPSTPPATSSNRCGPISNSATTPASSIGTPRSSA
jgi:cytochrome bd ubiquinol oxidase subunit II